MSATPNPKTSSQGGGTHQNLARPPLLPSEADNGIAPRRPKSREITSRYLSSSSTSSSSSSSYSSSSRRCPSPLISRTSASSTTMSPMPAPSSIRRPQSAERRRPSTPNSRPGSGVEQSNASKMLFTSTRSLSVSFQGESFSLPISKTKPAPSPNVSSTRRGTPERRKTTPLKGADQRENSKPVGQHQWPGRSRQVNSLSRSVDCSDDKNKLFGSGNVIRALQQSLTDEGKKDSSFDDNSALGSETIASDAESVSSGSTSGAHESGNGASLRGGPRGIVVPARFWQETNSRLRRLPESSSPLSKNTGPKVTVPPKIFPPRKSVSESPSASPRAIPSGRGLSSPLRGPVRPASPSKLMTPSVSSPSRGMLSPSRVRNTAVGTLGNNLCNTPSILSFAADVRRGKTGENRIVDAHHLRLLYNRHLQWRFVNARADASLFVQSITAERSLYNAWVTTTKLRDSVTNKRIMVQLLRQNLKLNSILKEHMAYLEEWAVMDRDYSSSLTEAIEALKASTFRLPVVDGARADVQHVKDAISSVVDVMHAMASYICFLLPKVEEMNSLVAELASVTAKERAFLNQCTFNLSTSAALQVKENSLRTHMLQLKRVT